MVRGEGKGGGGGGGRGGVCFARGHVIEEWQVLVFMTL